MNALIIVAIALVAAGLLITVILWLRTPDAAESEYVTVAELRARLEDEQEPDAGAGRTGAPDRPQSAEPQPEPEQAETVPDDTSAARSAVPPDTGPRAARESTAGTPSHEEPAGDTPADESEIHGPTPKQAPDSGEEPPTGEAGRNH